MDLDKRIGRALDALADSTDLNRVAWLLEVADLFRQVPDVNPCADADRLVADVYTLVADADLVATGQLSHRHATHTGLEPLLGPVIDRMARIPDLRQRAALVAELAALIDDEVAAESVAHMPYGGLVGGRDVMFMPSSPVKLARNVWRRWRESRAV